MGKPSPRNHHGFESAVKRLVSYAEFTGLDPTEHNDFRSNEFLKAFSTAANKPGSLKRNRAPIRHFIAWLAQNRESILDVNSETIERFIRHDCNCTRQLKGEFRKNSYIRIISDFLLFLQLQGFRASYGWTKEYSSLLLKFRDSLQSSGLGQQYANQIALQATHFVEWAQLNGVKRTEVNKQAIQNFLEHDCNCISGFAKKELKDSLRTLRCRSVSRWLRFLESGESILVNGVVARIDRQDVTLKSESLNAYRKWLIDHRGLRPSTIAAYMIEIMRWHDRLGEDASTYTAALIRDLAKAEMRDRSPTYQSRFITVIRSYLNYRASKGECSASLANSLISRKVYTKGSVPRSIPFEKLRETISLCDTSRPIDLRAKAIMTLLLETGMRAGEVGSLQLNDIDWGKAQLKVRGKGGRAAVMPLPQGAGDAILDWLEHGRPNTEDCSLFVRLRAPHTGLCGRGAITVVVIEALARANISGMGGAHLFRHSLARKLLQEGSGLPDIAGVLRHQQLDTTMLYAKVDDAALSNVARAWPGRGEL